MKNTKERELENLYNELELVIRRNFINIPSKFTVEKAIENYEYHSFTTSDDFSDTARNYIYFNNGIVEVESSFSGFRSKDRKRTINHLNAVVKNVGIKETLDYIIQEIEKIKKK